MVQHKLPCFTYNSVCYGNKVVTAALFKFLATVVFSSFFVSSSGSETCLPWAPPSVPSSLEDSSGAAGGVWGERENERDVRDLVSSVRKLLAARAACEKEKSMTRKALDRKVNKCRIYYSIKFEESEKYRQDF